MSLSNSYAQHLNMSLALNTPFWCNFYMIFTKSSLKILTNFWNVMEMHHYYSYTYFKPHHKLLSPVGTWASWWRMKAMLTNFTPWHLTTEGQVDCNLLTPPPHIMLRWRMCKGWPITGANALLLTSVIIEVSHFYSNCCVIHEGTEPKQSLIRSLNGICFVWLHQSI